MDAITMLKEDHQTVEQLFKRFEKAGDRAFSEKRKIADQVVEALSKHAAIEEQVFYPVARATVPDTEDVVLESLEEHHIVKWVLSELDGMDPAEERFDAKMTVLIENVRHHVEEEEQEFFPKVRAELDRNALAEVGEALEAAKQAAPSGTAASSRSRHGGPVRPGRCCKPPWSSRPTMARPAACCGSTLGAGRAASTGLGCSGQLEAGRAESSPKARPQLYATLAAPQCEARARRWVAVGSSANR